MPRDPRIDDLTRALNTPPKVIGRADYELQVLRMLAGTGPDLPWGSAVGAALGALKGMGLVSLDAGKYSITERGRAALGESND